MDWKSVSSRVLSAVAYENGTLHVKYNNGKTYQHPGVPKNKVDALLAAESKGKYFNTHIKPHHPAK